jgi:hypothetical protein
MFAAGAVFLDPDPTVLRGAVSLGNQLRWWSFSSSAADQYKSSKRRLRRTERGTNQANERYAGTQRVNLKGYIENEQYELERDKVQRRKHAEQQAARYGTELLDDEDEALAYALLLSTENAEAEEKKRRESEFIELSRQETVKPTPSNHAQSSSQQNGVAEEEVDPDIAEAIRLSLAESNGTDPFHSGSTEPSAFDFPIKYAKGKKSASNSPWNTPAKKGQANAGSSNDNELSDLEFAMQLSLAEEQSRKEMEEDQFPALSPRPGGGKGKGKARGW